MQFIKKLKNSKKFLSKTLIMVETTQSLSLIDYIKSKPTPLIEGPEPGQDISYQWVSRNEELKLIEEGIAFDEFSDAIAQRNLEMEFRVIK